MNTNVSDSMFHFKDEQADITIVRYVPARDLERPWMRFLRPIAKWFGFLSTLAWGMAALSPEAFRIPASMQGYAFLLAILWFFAYCAGFFNL